MTKLTPNPDAEYLSMNWENKQMNIIENQSKREPWNFVTRTEVLTEKLQVSVSHFIRSRGEVLKTQSMFVYVKETTAPGNTDVTAAGLLSHMWHKLRQGQTASAL